MTTSSLPVGTVTLPVPLAASSKLPFVSFEVICLPSIVTLSIVKAPNTPEPNVPVTTSSVILASE